jgi:hypothetical protein
MPNLKQDGFIDYANNQRFVFKQMWLLNCLSYGGFMSSHHTYYFIVVAPKIAVSNSIDLQKSHHSFSDYGYWQFG